MKTFFDKIPKEVNVIIFYVSFITVITLMNMYLDDGRHGPNSSFLVMILMLFSSFAYILYQLVKVIYNKAYWLCLAIHVFVWLSLYLLIEYWSSF